MGNTAAKVFCCISMSQLMDHLRAGNREAGHNRAFPGKEMREGMRKGIPLPADEVKRQNERR